MGVLALFNFTINLGDWPAWIQAFGALVALGFSAYAIIDGRKREQEVLNRNKILSEQAKALIDQAKSHNTILKIEATKYVNSKKARFKYNGGNGRAPMRDVITVNVKNVGAGDAHNFYVEILTGDVKTIWTIDNPWPIINKDDTIDLSFTEGNLLDFSGILHFKTSEGYIIKQHFSRDVPGITSEDSHWVDNDFTLEF